MNCLATKLHCEKSVVALGKACRTVEPGVLAICCPSQVVVFLIILGFPKKAQMHGTLPSTSDLLHLPVILQVISLQCLKQLSGICKLYVVNSVYCQLCFDKYISLYWYM